MSATKQKNSIIALATLGVYLGLLMAGATPGVLAQQAAMTRHFDVRDEIEISDDLDTKPEPTLSDEVSKGSLKADADISRSVRKFLAKFQPTGSLESISSQPESVNEFPNSLEGSAAVFGNSDHVSAQHISRILSVENLARGSLDPLVA